ncbi:tyrosine-type recombinase/integrase [Fluviibacter phosphoraccumulans]|uniref:Integrase n=1 Tax=Fluviibacter phosphoraccumulans TaxID=1751046 RepID=A0A7R6RCX7_9RHOO|nr:integrase arm-type DNA-binding domain-containing protein [Fluviibacter phosphoraccumulans]BBU68661.1 integrase [Fluviibacter phosphoraccumulans]BBU72184.1 integrase [Fluviibacter phosphoraccumulans]
MALTDLKVKAAKAGDKPYKLTDERGLHLLIATNGGKYWRWSYRFIGKQKTMALGTYPDTGLADARNRRDEARKLLAGGVDPSEDRKVQRSQKVERAANSFEAIARRWYAQGVKSGWTESYASKTLRRLEKDVFPWIGNKPVAELQAPDFLTVSRRVSERGAVDTSHRITQVCGQIMRFAIAEGIADRNPVADLRGALPSAPVKHMASVTDPVRVGELLRAFDAFKGTLTVQCALRLAPLVFTRPVELRKARWADIDLDAGMWTIPAEMMKMRKPHLVPLSTQAVTILREIQPLSGDGEYVFPGARDPKRPMSDAAINAALKRLGIDTKEELTGHGFRAMARTILHEQLGYAPEWIEQQLAHKTSDPLGEAYARAKFINQRREMMQAWADYLEKLKKGAAIIIFPTQANQIGR